MLLKLNRSSVPIAATTQDMILNRWFRNHVPSRLHPVSSLTRARHHQPLLLTTAVHQLCQIRNASSSIYPLPSQPKSYPYDVTIGSTTVTVRSPPKSPELVPHYCQHESGEFLTATDLSHLEWMMKKEALLRQDMFLIGPPGGYKRRLVGLYAHLFGRELEVIQISRDSTEADIKQIREIRGKTVVYFDQASVRAALNGHMLVLDGIEKAERNVLPLLNNLLENREMHLEDGRHLIPHTRYDQLVKEHGPDAVKRWKLERVHPDFRVCALGLPIPAFRGNPLDPPLRSRFQGRNIGGGFGRSEVLDLLIGGGGSKDVGDGVRRIVDLAFGINFMNSREFKERLGGEGDFGKKRVGADVPWFVVDNLFDGVRVFESIVKSSSDSIPSALLPEIFRLMYPFKSSKVESLVTEQLGQPAHLKLKTVPSDLLARLRPPPLQSQVSTLSLLHEFLKLKGARRAALLHGGQGCGKSTVAGYVGELLGGKAVTVVQAYKDMSTRDLFQVRGTDLGGDTVWRESPLVEAAVSGGVCVLDGVEHLHESVVGVLGGLVREGGVLLPDGVTVLGGIMREDEATIRGPLRRLTVHPDFRLIGVADSSDLKLTPELCSVFMVFGVGMGEEEEALVCGGGEEVAKVLRVLRELRRRGEAGDKGCLALSRGLSVAQVKRIGRRVEGRRGKGAPQATLYRDVHDALCGQFLPMMERAVVREVLEGCGIGRDPISSSGQREVHVRGNRFRIGFVEGDVHEEAEEFVAKVPRGGLFFDIDQHVGVLERLADDFLNGGDHLLVVGNQGVGKNKIVDRFLGVVGRGREYVQLHRDTTVQSLTTNQRIEDGVIKAEDSPLVNAVRNGLVLVIDEADKAPAHVTAVLKTLAERGEMVLGDGRRIVRCGHGDDSRFIQLHPSFRMIVLANRPGFPFLGNSFYGSMSHLFSVNPVDNPGVESEVQLLEGYGGGGVEQRVIESVAKVFGELRGLSDEGVLGYPYSTREAVHVVRHLRRFPGEVAGALSNVFDFDEWGDDERWRVVKRVVERGLGAGALGGRPVDSEIGLKVVEWGKKGGGGGGEGGESSRKDFSRFGDPKEGKIDASGGAHVGGNTWAGGSGGMSTAGLGGVGGPYRLSDGNAVFQVSAQARSSVPPEVVQKARELNRKLYAERLRELRMSAHDSTMYNELLEPILPQIHSLRNILESLQARSEERKWVKHQTSGDLDEGKLVEGLIGDRDVYRGRVEKRPEVGDPLVKPKLLRLLVDVSGSMYRFNGYDRRLERVLSAVLMVMEGVKDYSQSVRVEIYGHSGDEYDWEVVGREGGGTLDSEERRFAVLKELFLHSQFCSSGDHTLEATAKSIEQLQALSDEFDELFLVVLSDANLERYGIRVEEFGEVLGRGESVRAYSVFIGSLGDQAERLKDGLGAGRGFVCLDVGELPRILERIFAEGILRG